MAVHEFEGATGTKPSDKSAWKTDPKKPGQRTRDTKAVRSLPLEIRLREFFVGLSGVATLAGDSFTAQAIEIKSEELAYGYAKLAQNDPRVKHVLQMLLEGSAWAEALIPTIGLLIVVGWHHGYVPDQIGVPFTVANGMMPVSRSMEKKMREQAQQDQSDAAGKPRPDKNGSGDGGNPTT